MKILDSLAGLLGVSGDRAAPPPQYEALADGLVLTADSAWAWFTVETSNSDLMSEDDRDAETDRAAAALASTLAGVDVHLRVLWSALEAGDYGAGAADVYSAGRWREWAAHRMGRLDQIGLPVRHILMGARLGERAASVPQRAADLAGVSSPGVGARELATWHAQARRLGRRLESSPWRCRTAPVDLLAWMVAREQHRAVPPPAAARGVIRGSALASLTRGRALPHPDHVRLIGADGEPAAWVCVLTFTAFPERLVTPGPGEWLRVLSEIVYAPESAGAVDPEHLLAPVSPEASVRLRVLPRREAKSRADSVRRTAKEQRHSAAAHSAEDPGRAIEETELAMADLIRDLERDDLSLVEDHPRLVVTSTAGLEDLRARVDAVITYYATVGIDVRIAEEEQRELWLETWAGDRLRVPDLGHVRDTTALAGSWWWGGAAVGDATGPVVGYLTGSTAGVVRLSVMAGADRGDATTTAYIGRSGRGKTTAMMVNLTDAALMGAWALALDFKGDLGGLVALGRRYGVASHLVETDRSMAGAADLMPLLASSGRDDARSEVPAQLSIVLPPHLREQGAESPVQQAVNAVMDGPDPATWRVIDYLRASCEDVARHTGAALYELAQTPLGAPFMGRPPGGTPFSPLSAEPGLRVVQMPGLSLPAVGEDWRSWTSAQRLSVGLMHSMLAFGVITAGRRDLRGLPKIVAVPEVHVLTATPEGRRFLDYVARVGRALGTHLLMDTQDAEALAAMPGVVEQLSTVVGFQLTSPAQADALAELLMLPPGRHTRDLIRSLGVGHDGMIRHGHSILRDWRMRAATMQWDLPTAEVRTLLDTSPRATAASAVPAPAPATKGAVR